jgi:hypothetical protein
MFGADMGINEDDLLKEMEKMFSMGGKSKTNRKKKR